MNSVLMDIQELSKYLNIKESKVRKMVFRNEIPFIKIGRLVRFSTQRIDDWILTLDSINKRVLKERSSKFFDSSSLNSVSLNRRRT